MSESICRFLPAEQDCGSIRTVRFVYETDFPKLRQPFLYPIFYLHIVTSGTGTLWEGARAHRLEAGTIFFAFPARPFEIREAENLRYVYISFMGSGVAPLLEQLQISTGQLVYPGFGELCPLYLSSVREVRSENVTALTQGLLLYTLARLAPVQVEERREPQQLFAAVVDYVDTHYREPDLSLKRLGEEFSYTEKYLSSLFKKHMQIQFSSYLNNLRIQRAMELLAARAGSIGAVAGMCGFSSPLYFSKVFKKRTGWTPTEYMRTVGADKP